MLRGFVIVCTVWFCLLLWHSGAGRPRTLKLARSAPSPSVSGTNTWTTTSGMPLSGWSIDISSSAVKYGAGVGGTLPSGPGLTGTQAVQLSAFTAIPPKYFSGGINQTVSGTIPGQAYTITVYAKDATNGPSTFATVDFGAQAYTVSGNGLNKSTWTPFAFAEAATGSSTFLDISGYPNTSDAVLIADLSVVLAQSNTVWLGHTSSDYGNPANWSSGYVPSAQGIAVLFGGARDAQPLRRPWFPAARRPESSTSSATLLPRFRPVPASLSIWTTRAALRNLVAINVSGSHTISAAP